MKVMELAFRKILRTVIFNTDSGSSHRIDFSNCFTPFLCGEDLSSIKKDIVTPLGIKLEICAGAGKQFVILSKFILKSS